MGVVTLINSDAGGNEHPLTTEHLQWYSDNIHPVVFLQPIIADMDGRAKGKIAELGLQPNDLLTFEMLAILKGRWPSTKIRFCTTHLKLEPQKRWIKEKFGVGGQYEDYDYERYTGVRRDESAARANVPDRGWDNYYDCYLNYPIASWTKQQCFDYCKGFGEKINPLYTLGFNRVGCAPCVNSNKLDIRNWASRFPQMIDKIRNWEINTGRTFFAPVVPGMEINWIDQVVGWAKTDRGGRQLNLFRENEGLPACESKYGLCE